MFHAGLESDSNFFSFYPPQQQEPTFPPPETYIATIKTSYTQFTSGFSPQTHFHMHPPSFSQFEAPTPPDQDVILPAAATMLPSYGNDRRDNRLLENNVTETSQSNVCNTFPCKLCNIICNHNDAFEKHIQGKKHQKNLGRKIAVDASVPQNATAGEISSKSNVHNNFPCKLCNIICNNIDAFEKHIQGKVHQKNLCKQVVVDTSVPQKVSAEEITSQSNVRNPFPCKLCNIICYNIDAFEQHIQGKHQTNLGRQIVVCTLSPPKATEGETTPVTSVVTSNLEMEKKKEMLLQNGATAGSLLFCTMCNVGCNDEGVFHTHLAGKKHASQVAKQATIRHLDGVGTSNLVPSVPPNENDTLEEPTSKTQTTQPPWCEICKISCSSHEHLKIHMAGKRHRKNLSKNVIGPCAPAAELVIGPMENTEENKVDALNLQKAGNMAKIIQQVDPNNLETDNGQSFMCEVCNISCTCLDNLNYHVAGKKHRKALEKSNRIIGSPAPITASASTPITGPTKDPDGYKGSAVELLKSKKKMKRSLASMDDVETKKQKIVEEGAALHSVRVCRVCAVVCNNPNVFISHLAGKKHHAMEKKQADAGLNSQTA